MKLLLKMGFF